jgi:SAM-dependent methyltransferase
MAADPESGARLRSLYASAGGARAVFSAKVADYLASRPGYPAALFDRLAAAGLPRGATVADVGAGTGLLTRDLLRRGYRVVAVEPNPEMRQAADTLLGDFAGYRGVEGCAESIPLAAASVDLITAAQAFHWFDVDRAREEFLRVLTPGGLVALIWNDRVWEDPLHVALDEVFGRFGGEKRAALVAHEDRSNVPRFFGAGPCTQSAWPHAQPLDEAGLLSLAFSRSYMPAGDSPQGKEADGQLRAIFRRLAVAGAVTVRYRTVMFLGRPG